MTVKARRYNMPVHTNGNLICVLDTETTGLDSTKHEIVEICIMPLRADFTPYKELLPFELQLKPNKPENVDPDAMRVNQLSLPHLMLNGIDQDRAVDLLIEWFEKLNLGEGKQLMPLAQNYAFDIGFLKAWMGPKTYNMIFNRYYRDTYPVANFLNDRADLVGSKIEYPKISLQYLCSILNVENPAPHRAIGDCIATAEVYRQLLKGAI